MVLLLLCWSPPSLSSQDRLYDDDDEEEDMTEIQRGEIHGPSHEIKLHGHVYTHSARA